MRTNIEIDDELMSEAMRRAGTSTKRATVELALRELVDRHRRLEILGLFGKYPDFPTLEQLRAPDSPTPEFTADPEALRFLKKYSRRPNG